MSNNTLGHRIKPAVQTGLTATGSTQATALALTNNTLHEFTSVPSSAGAILPVGVTPSEISIFNSGASSLSIYPPTGGSIDDGTANASVALAAGAGATFWASTPSNWYHLVSNPSVVAVTPGGSSGQIQYDNAGAFGGFTASGDATISTSTGAVTVTKTNGTAFAPSATIDTTNASNITSGSLALTELAPIATHSVLANTTGGASSPAGVTLTSLIDAALGNTQGDVLFRGASSWGVLAPGLSNQFLQSGGPSANPSWGTPSPGGGTPGGISGQIQYDNSGAFGGFTMSGDATLVTSTGVITVTKTNGTAFGPYASLADATQGDLPYFGASAAAALAAGTANTPLQTGGSAANPSWNGNILLPTAGPTRRTTGPIFTVAGPGTAVANTTTQTSLFTGATLNGTVTIPANSLVAGQAIHLFLMGTYGCTGATPNLQIFLLLGGTVIAQTGNATLAAVAQTNGIWVTSYSPLTLVFPTVGASGSVLANGYVLLYEETTVGTAAFAQPLLNGTASVGTPTAINTTGSLAIDFQAKWSAASTSNTMQLLGGYGEIIG